MMDNKNVKQFQFPQAVIVEASAGSGKTYALARRYLQLLINPYLKPEEIPLNTILAITFTNKSAIEMKERVLEFLKKLALDKFEDKEEKENLLSSLHVEEEAARRKAHRIMDYLIRNYNFFQVQTIDSFINAILSGCAFKLNLSAGFKTEKDYTDYLAYSLDKLIDRAGRDREILDLFHNFLKHYLFIENKTGWFPKQDILSIIESLYSKNNRFAGRFVRNNIEAKDLISHKKNTLKVMEKLKENLPEGTNKVFSNKLSDFLDENKEGFDIDGLSDFFEREDFPVNKGGIVPAEVKKCWEKIRSDIKELCEQESKSAYNYYVNIFNNVLFDLEKITTADDVLFLEALNKEARGLFDREAEFLPELYCRLATRFKHFLIDEFQDTSGLQWANLLLMVEDALSRDGSLFYVGDKKQAIYRFRGGEVSLIDSVKGRIHTANLLQEKLSRNYRSQREIVEFNNLVFSEENLKRFLDEITNKKADIDFIESDIKRVLDVFKDSRQEHKDEKTKGYVRAEFIDFKNKEEIEESIKEKALNLVKDLKERFSYKDIALLVRKNKEVELLTSWLLEEKIPVESERTLNIRENSYIKELVSFLKFLNSPIDNLSFASFILGEIFSKASGIGSEEIQDFIFKVNNGDKEKTSYLYREFRRQYPEVWERFIEEFFRSVGFVPLYELVISIFGSYNVIKEFHAHQGFFMRFLELIKEREEEHPGISSFLEFFDRTGDEDLYVNVTESDAVKILTVHKAKGLEFPAVIIPFLELNVKIDPGVVVSNDGNLRLMHVKKKYASYSPRLKELYKDEYLKYFIDELNGIYVALTRAKDELYVFIPSKGERGANPAGALFQERDLEKGKKAGDRKRGDKRELPAIEIPYSEYKDWLHLLKEEFIDESILKDRDRILKGEVLHYILSFIGNLHGKEKGPVVKEALKNGQAQYPFIDYFEKFESTVKKLLEDKGIKPYFDVRDGEVETEKEIVDSSGNTKRIDRLIVRKDEVIIIDYKSAKEEGGAYYDQMSEYVRIISEIYPGLKVKGVLIYLDNLKTEEVNAKNHNL